MSVLRNSTSFYVYMKDHCDPRKEKKTSAVEQKWPNDWTVKKVLDRCSSFLFEQKIDPSFQDYYYYSFWMLKIIQKKQRNGRAHIPKRSNWNLVKKVVLWIEAGQYPKCWLEFESELKKKIISIFGLLAYLIIPSTQKPYFRHISSTRSITIKNRLLVSFFSIRL